MTLLHIRFRKLGFFFKDARVQVRLDGRVVYAGGFRAGFEYSAEVPPGPHTIATEISVGPLSRDRSYAIELGGAGEFTATLAYSRFWGNFAGTLELARG